MCCKVGHFSTHYNMPSKVQTWCQVEVVDFRFEDYPDHVKNLHTYAFKPLIVQVTWQKKLLNVTDVSVFKRTGTSLL